MHCVAGLLNSDEIATDQSMSSAARTCPALPIVRFQMMGVIETIRFLGAIDGIIATKDMDVVSKLSVLVGRRTL